MVEAEQVQDRRMEIVRMHLAFDGAKAHLIRSAALGRCSSRCSLKLVTIGTNDPPILLICGSLIFSPQVSSTILHTKAHRKGDRT
jgi:hypothetical protein